MTKLREELATKDKNRSATEGEVAILKNQLSAFASELANKRIHVSHMNSELEIKMQRLDAAKKKFHAEKERLTREVSAQDNLERANKVAEDEFKQSQNMLTEVEKEIRT